MLRKYIIPAIIVVALIVAAVCMGHLLIINSSDDTNPTSNTTTPPAVAPSTTTAPATHPWPDLKPNTPDDLILRIGDKEHTLFEKRARSVLNALLVDYSVTPYEETENDKNHGPAKYQYKNERDPFHTLVTMDECFNDEQTEVLLSRVQIEFLEDSATDITIFGIGKGMTPDDVFRILGAPMRFQTDGDLTTYYWPDVQFGSHLVPQISIVSYKNAVILIDVSLYAQPESEPQV